jgi:hypothetical protein
MPTQTPSQTHFRTPPHNNTTTHATPTTTDRRHAHDHAPHLQACMPDTKTHQSNTQHHRFVQLPVTSLDICRSGRGLPATLVGLPTHSRNTKRSTRDTHTHRPCRSAEPDRVPVWLDFDGQAMTSYAPIAPSASSSVLQCVHSTRSPSWPVGRQKSWPTRPSGRPWWC